MSEAIEDPIIHISGVVSENECKAAIRRKNVRVFLNAVIAYVITVSVMTPLMSFFSEYSYLKSGVVTYGQWIRALWNSMTSSVMICLFVGLSLLYAITLFLFKPFRIGRSFRELYPDGMPVAYDFYGDRLVISSFSQSAESTDRLNYSDVRRRIRETGYIITLSTSRKNYYNLFKCIMKPEEVTSVREILKARCPQRKQ